MQPEQIQKISHNGLAYFTQGKKQNPPILFLHGFMGSSRDWLSIAGHFAESCFCLLPDLPGHGASTDIAENHYTMPACGKLIIALMDDLQIRTAHLVGYSMGARLAFYLAAFFPSRFRCIVLESASPGLHSAEEQKQRILQDESLAQKLESDKMEEFLDFWYELPLFATLQKHKLLHMLKKSRMQNQPAKLALSLRKMGTGSMPDLWPHLASIDKPVLLMTGEKDRKFCAINKAIAKQLPDCRHEIMTACGHNMHFENREMFIDLITSFFRENRR